MKLHKTIKSTEGNKMKLHKTIKSTEGNKMKLHKTIKSTEDNTHKFIYLLNDRLKSEISVIFRKDGRISLCVPSQTWCNMKCRMCHLTGSEYSQHTRNLRASELVEMILTSLNSLPEHLTEGRTQLLVAYMGIGEPLLNTENILSAFNKVKKKTDFATYKVSIATMVPKKALGELFKFAYETRNEHSKIHYSIHSMSNRKYLIPCGIESAKVIDVMNLVNKTYGTELELHYNLIKDVNDSFEEIRDLADIGIPISFIRLADTDELFKTSEAHVEALEETLQTEYPNLSFECYTPPGASIRASCGQFSVEEYGSRG